MTDSRHRRRKKYDFFEPQPLLRQMCAFYIKTISLFFKPIKKHLLLHSAKEEEEEEKRILYNCKI